MDIRLVSLDLDGTLLPQSQVISERARSAIRQAQAQGVEIVCNTGRALSEMDYIFEQLPPMRYVCCCTGAFVADLTEDRVISHTPLTADEGRAIYAVLREYPCVINFFAGGTVHNDRAVMERYLPLYPAALQSVFFRTHVVEDDLDAFVAAYDGVVDKFYVSFTDKAARSEAFRQVAAMGYYVTDAGFVDFEIMHRGVDKATALAALAAHLGLTRAQVCAMGDSGNDVPMLRYAGLPVAMANAAPAVQAAARVIAPDNEHDGVADTLERILRGELA